MRWEFTGMDLTQLGKKLPTIGQKEDLKEKFKRFDKKRVSKSKKK